MMFLTVFQYILAVFGISVLWMTGNGFRVGWLLGALLQIAWAYYSIATGQYGFLIEVGAYFFLFTRTWKRLGRLDPDAQEVMLDDD